MISKGEKKLLALGLVLVILDQVIKVLVKTSFTLGGGFDIFSWFRIVFIENEGMAFGMKFGGAVGKACLSLFRIVLCVILTLWISRLSRREGENKVPTGVLIGLTLITAGAFGNILDSLFYGQIFSASSSVEVASLGGSYAPILFGKVVDMFYFPLFRWPDWLPLIGGDVFFGPVFNFADSCVSVGAVYLILFQYKFFSKEK